MNGHHPLVHKSCGGQLCDKTVPKNFVEAALMMVETLFAFIVNSTHVNHNRACLKDSRIASAHKVSIRRPEYGMAITGDEQLIPAFSYALLLRRRKTARASSQ